ncbi:phosphate ABC transporter, periplasmic phosphate-binding protein [Beutenbergia cavernae DSM 12333]|uniref:Phosphate-binding protein n=1 Tax=Beutenbergia cavernae (strain ATCC BAA-8 / DSM 12333 / CCUG 43141 / JCM 11478 / NBRC 16432 / NCIMB 13614 / HKI 0122) TaxID=471853 RepID=C5C243_BEUC1|nr:phosphate ABC transporter substrate-binding protein PstS [Beutenbergia cavernae]ACQ81668.1 phosphate ABC transporter, periplasmic phosphate-binding protein [Beutenbergia cavernae DSM 12333]
MKLVSTRRSRGAALAAVAAGAALLLAACGGNADGSENGTDGEETTDGGSNAADLSGVLAGAGASSQEAAMAGWQAGFGDLAPNVQFSYDAVGSSGGREQFLSGGVQFAGSDAALDPDELAAATERCFGGEALELPLYISPIAVVYNLPDLGVENLQLDAATIAQIFNGDITSWDDPAIAEANPDATLPALAIIPVNRSDGSGTTENFTEYLAAASEGAWPHEPSDAWPVEGGQSGNGTSGLIDTVNSAEGTIGYADASRAGDLGTVALQVGEEYVPYSAEAAAAVVDASPATEDATDLRLTVELDRTTTAAGAYPLVLISYSIACSTYDNEEDAANVAALLSYIASPEGQERSAQPDVAGSAPISDDLRTRVEAAIAEIGTA